MGRAVVLTVAAALMLYAGARRPHAQGTGSVSVVEASIASLRRAMEEGRTTSRAITEQYLARIARYETTLNAAITINPRALEEADARDRERRQRKIRGPLHGIPIALKDNIHTTDMPTTGGALAFAGLRPPYEAAITTRLRNAGAIILAKTTLTELANWIAAGMPSGYSALAGYSFNPYDTNIEASRASKGPPLLTPGGSSSGIGTAASFWAANVGTETSGSILNPANQNMLVGIKPTVGRISRHGIIPITADQDTPGPLARTVEDAAILLGVMEQTAPDRNDPATRACAAEPAHDYTRHLRRDGLRGARIGIPRAFFYDRQDGTPRRNMNPPERQAMDEAIGAVTAAGAVVVDTDLPSVVTADRANNVLARSICAGRGGATGPGEGCSIVFQYGMKRDFNAWLRSLGSRAPVRSLTELRAWNRDHAGEHAIDFGQAQLDGSDAIDLMRDRQRYESDRRTDLRLAGAEGIDAALRAGNLDALLFPTYTGAFVAARAGYPSVIVPFGFATAARTDPPTQGSATNGSPFGVTFTGGACTEGRLIELAYAFEQATRRRIAPPFP